jgi:hypothetical protein
MEYITVREKYNSLGFNTDQLKTWLKTQDHNGYDESFDGSLLVVYFSNFTAIVTTSHLSFVGA